jgi:prepilin-type processing-associated H-X9-DG protein
MAVQASGVFWRTSPGIASVSLDGISNGDGLGQTVLLAENIQSGNWISRDIDYVGFGVPLAVTSNYLGAPSRFNNGEVGPAVPGFTGLLQIAPTYRVYNTLDYDGRINAKLSQPRGKAPRPSSNHSGNVNFVFCDGAARPINANINQAVYTCLLSWDGQRRGQPLVDESSFRN